MHMQPGGQSRSSGIKLVIFDCDRTLWDHHNVSELRPPFRRVDENTVEDQDGIRVRLLPGARELLDELKRQGIILSIASWNRPEPVFQILDLLGLSPYFTRPKVEFHPYKERTVAVLLKELAEDGVTLAPEEILYIDDRPLHLRRMKAALGPIRTLQAGQDISDLRKVLHYVVRSS